MTDYFLDASALAKRYAPEPGSEWVISITDPPAGHVILVAHISLVEVSAALAAKQRARSGTDLAAWDRALGRFLEDCEERFVILPIEQTVIDTAVGLTRQHRLRGYDAVQLAAATVTNDTLVRAGHAPLVFVAADNDLLAAAAHHGLDVESPLDHAGTEPMS